MVKTTLYLFKQEPLGNVKEEEMSGEIQASAGMGV